MVDLVFCSIGDGNNIALYVKHHPPCLTPLICLLIYRINELSEVVKMADV